MNAENVLISPSSFLHLRSAVSSRSTERALRAGKTVRRLVGRLEGGGPGGDLSLSAALFSLGCKK